MAVHGDVSERYHTYVAIKAIVVSKYLIMETWGTKQLKLSFIQLLLNDQADDGQRPNTWFLGSHGQFAPHHDEQIIWNHVILAAINLSEMSAIVGFTCGSNISVIRLVRCLSVGRKSD